MTARNIALAISLGCHVASQPMLSLGGLGTATSSPQEERRLLIQKSMNLLEEALSDRQHVRLAENRVRLAAIAAGSLWTIDPDRSRALFQEAKQELIVLIDRIDPSDRDYYSQVGIPQQLRHEILAMISQKDPALALDFIRTTRLPPRPKSGPFDHPHDEEAAIELQLAAQIASNDPSQAFRLACEQLERGPSPNTVNVLFSLQEKSPEMAKELSQLFFQKLQSSASRKTGATEGFGILETLVGQLNSLVDAMAVLDGFVGQNQFKEGEFLCHQGGQIGQYVLQAISALAGFVSHDFDRAQQIANRFQRTELRASTRLAVAQAGLSTATVPPKL